MCLNFLIEIDDDNHRCRYKSMAEIYRTTHYCHTYFKCYFFNNRNKILNKIINQKPKLQIQQTMQARLDRKLMIDAATLF